MLIQNAERLFEDQELLLLYHDDSYHPTPVFHKHNYYEITIMLSGKMDCHFKDCTYSLYAGDVLLIRPDEIHWKESYQNGKHFNVSVLSSVIDSAMDYLANDNQKTALLTSGHLLPHTLPSPAFKHISQTVTQLSDDYVTSSPNMRIRLRSLVSAVLSAYLVMSTRFGVDDTDMPRWLIEYFDNFYQQPNLVKGVSYFMDAPISHGHLCRLFKKHLHMTIIQFVNNARLTYAAKTLLQSDMPIIDISAEVGFSSLSHFYRLFKEKYGVTPKEYRTLGADIRATRFKTIQLQD